MRPNWRSQHCQPPPISSYVFRPPRRSPPRSRSRCHSPDLATSMLDLVPWREFLLGKVTCRSVTELRSVTGMDEQDIIRFFLSTQDENNLMTRGPFNKPFRNTDKEGFSIDVKPELETLISCGLIPLKISTLQGPSLVSLDLTPGPRRLTHADHSMTTWRPMDECLCCLEPPAPGDERDATLGISLNMTWIKILGLYNRKGMKFR